MKQRTSTPRDGISNRRILSRADPALDHCHPGAAPGSRGLDLGCGIGLQTPLLAEAIGPQGRVTGLDISAGLLAYARNRIMSLPVNDQITFKEGDMLNLPFPDDTFDQVERRLCRLSSGRSLPVLKEITRVVGQEAPSLFWPGPPSNCFPAMPCWRPGNATCSAYASFLQQKSRVALSARAPLVRGGRCHGRCRAHICRGCPGAA